MYVIDQFKKKMQTIESNICNLKAHYSYSLHFLKVEHISTRIFKNHIFQNDSTNNI